MKKSTCIMLLLINLTVITVAQTLPSKIKVFCPDYITNQKGDKNWQDMVIKKIKNGDFGNQTGTTPWTVLSDRENNTTYTSPSLSSGTFSQLKFVEKVYVADIQSGFALVFSDENKQNKSGTFNPSAICKGWIPVENLILWNQCPKDENQIYKRGVVVYSPSPGSTASEGNPNYLLSPMANARQTQNISQDLDILYCMKTVTNNNKRYYLLSKEHIFSTGGNQQERVLLGWLNEDYVTEWKNRLLLEPTYASAAVSNYKDKNIYPCIFPEDDNGQNNARNFLRNGVIKRPLWIYDKFVPGVRMNSFRMRNPIIENSGDLFRVATLSTFEQSGETAEKIADAKRKIEKYKQALDNINVIFVIDATSSMTKYFPAVAQSLEKIIKHDFSSKIKVGAVLYKDYKDPDRIQIKPITSNIEEVIGFINTSKSRLGSVDADDWEAMFLGLETALDKSKMKYSSEQSNFVILIGDAGNQRKNPEGKDWQILVSDLSKQMCNNNINFLAYQVNHTGAMAYNDFGLQIGVLQKEFSEKFSSQLNVKTEYKIEKNGFYSLVRANNNNEILPRYIKFKYLKSGQSETDKGLKSIIIDNIIDFQKIVENNIKVFNSIIGGKSDIQSAGALQEQEVVLNLRSMRIPEPEISDIITVLRSGRVVKFFGYTSNKTISSNYNLFDYVLLFSDKELEELIQVFSVINSSSVNDHKAFQDAMLSVGQSMLGNFRGESTRIDEMLQQIYGLPIKLKNCGDFTIESIVGMDKYKLNGYIEDFNKKLTELIRIKNNARSDYTFKSNGNTYFWIKLIEMPGVCE
jgi:hypothetical protein